MRVILELDRWGVDWTGWAELRRPGRSALRFPIANYIVWC